MGNLQSTFQRQSAAESNDRDREGSTAQEEQQARRRNNRHRNTEGTGVTGGSYNLRHTTTRIERRHSSSLPEADGQTRRSTRLGERGRQRSNEDVENLDNRPNNSGQVQGRSVSSESRPSSPPRRRRRRRSSSADEEERESQRPRLSPNSPNSPNSPFEGFIALPSRSDSGTRYFFLSNAPSPLDPAIDVTNNNEGLLSSLVRTILNNRRNEGSDDGEPASIIIRCSRVNPPDAPIGGITLQWTVFIMAPNRTRTSLNSPLSPQHRHLIDRAIQFIHAMSSGWLFLGNPGSIEGGEYEYLLHLQEMLGVVSRGVPKDLINTQLPAIPVDPHKHSSCTICLEDYREGEQIRLLPCQHLYHVACIDGWLVVRNSCPVCRQEPVQM